MKLKNMKRYTFRASDDVVSKLENIALRYGMSVNALCSFVIGRWVDENYDLKEKGGKSIKNG